MKILIADDETPIREWIQFSIERGKNPEFEVVGVAENGNEAFEMALEYQVDTVITDIKMPGMDGLMLMKGLQKELPYVSFIILTNHAEFSYAREAITYGAKKYMLKSEMRGKDILDALTEIRENTAKLLENKEADCYSSGYLDIYNCCYHSRETEYVQEFWRKHHFAEHLKFRVLAVKRDDILFQKKLIDDFAKACGECILRPILRQDNIYLIIQSAESEGLERIARSFDGLWESERQGIVVSSRESSGTEQVLVQIGEAERLLQYGFFFESGYFAAEEADEWERLNREDMKHRYRQILGAILTEDKDVLMLKMNQWFSEFSNSRFSSKDIGWAREICLKMIMHTEEIFGERFSGYQDEKEPEKMENVRHCCEFCGELLEMLYSGDHVSYSQSVREAVCYIHQYYGRQELSLKEVAKAIYRSPEYLSRLFKAETGKNFSAYLMDYRMAKANSLLLETDMKIYEIAYATGYANPSYFSKVYHEYTGVTPEMTRSQKNIRMS